MAGVPLPSVGSPDAPARSGTSRPDHLEFPGAYLSDPLEIHRVARESPQVQRRLNAVTANLHGLPPDAVVNLALSIFVEAVCQQHSGLTAASALFDEVTWKARQYLLAHYNPASGRKVYGLGTQILHG